MSVQEKMFRSLLGALGVQPQEVLDGLKFVVSEAMTLRQEREGFKSGVQIFVPEVWRRVALLDEKMQYIVDTLERHEKKIDLVLQYLRAPDAAPDTTPVVINGELNHVRNARLDDLGPGITGTGPGIAGPVGPD
jgi:hypothetical protein